MEQVHRTLRTITTDPSNAGFALSPQDPGVCRYSALAGTFGQPLPTRCILSQLEPNVKHFLPDLQGRNLFEQLMKLVLLDRCRVMDPDLYRFAYINATESNRPATVLGEAVKL